MLPRDTSAPSLDQQAADLTSSEARLAAAGHTLTAQRRAILRFLAARTDHPTATVIYEAVTRDFPISSRATVYNTLSLLVELGMVTTVLGGEEVRYDPNLAPHHHLRCERCGALQDIPAEDVTVYRGGVPAEGRVEFRGQCEACAADSATT